MLPGGNGFDICRTVRQRGVQTPILMLTARGQVVDRVVGLSWAPMTTWSNHSRWRSSLRIEALLRRSAASPQAATEAARFGDVAVDFRRAEVTKGGAIVELSAREFKLLRWLHRAQGRPVAR